MAEKVKTEKPAKSSTRKKYLVLQNAMFDNIVYYKGETLTADGDIAMNADYFKEIKEGEDCTPRKPLMYNRAVEIQRENDIRKRMARDLSLW